MVDTLRRSAAPANRLQRPAFDCSNDETVVNLERQKLTFPPAAVDAAEGTTVTCHGGSKTKLVAKSAACAKSLAR